MIDDLTAIDPPSRDETAAELAARRQAQFKQANASLALEGLRVDANDLAIQDKIAKGELTADDAVAFYLSRATKSPV